MLAKIKKRREFDKLVFYIISADVVFAILKTMIFTHNLDKQSILAIYLQNPFLTYIKSDRKMLIRRFSLIFKLDIKAKYINDFCNGDTKI